MTMMITITNKRLKKNTQDVPRIQEDKFYYEINKARTKQKTYKSVGVMKD